MKKIWTYFTSANFLRQANGWLTLFWVGMIPVSIVTGWIHSIVYVSALSIWALVASHWAAWQAGRVESKQDEKDEKSDS